MCGLVGFVGQDSKKVKQVMDFMLLVDQIRGLDSTGISTISSTGTVKTFKRAMHSTDFLCMRQTNKLLDGYGHNAIIGHNRAATKGVVNTENAHPFTHGNITLAHNGTLRKQNLLPDHEDFDVDSENICHAINLNGVEDTVESLCGAFALSYYDDNTKTINLVRNAERPLYYTTSTCGANMFWASEAWMITVACAKAGIVIEPCTPLPIGELLTIPVKSYYKDGITNHITTTPLKLHVVKAAPKVGGVSTNNAGTNMFRIHSFVLETQVIVHSAGVLGYRYTGVTTCGKYDVRINSVDRLYLGVTYQGNPSTFNTNSSGRYDLLFSKCWAAYSKKEKVIVSEDLGNTAVKKH